MKFARRLVDFLFAKLTHLKVVIDMLNNFAVYFKIFKANFTNI